MPMICFVSAMEKEASYILEVCETTNEEKAGFGRLLFCRYQNESFYILICGIGKVLASSSLSAALSTHKEIDYVLNIGVAGGLKRGEINVFDVVIGQQFVQHDLDTSPLGDPKGMVSGINVVYFDANEDLNEALAGICGDFGVEYHVRNVISGDKFIVDPDEKYKLAEEFDAVCCDMESAALATVCYVMNKGFSCLRVVSDSLGGSNEYFENLDDSCILLSKLCLKLISE